MRYDLKHPSKEPVVWSSLVKDGLVIIFGGLTVFNVFEPTPEQYAWLLTAFGFVSMVVAFALREQVWSSEKVENEFLSAEDALPVASEATPIEDYDPPEPTEDEL